MSEKQIRVELYELGGEVGPVRLPGSTPITMVPESEVKELEAERQAVLDVINLYGDSTLHGALDDAGLLMHPQPDPKTRA